MCLIAYDYLRLHSIAFTLYSIFADMFGLILISVFRVSHKGLTDGGKFRVFFHISQQKMGSPQEH